MIVGEIHNRYGNSESLYNILIYSTFRLYLVIMTMNKSVCCLYGVTIVVYFMKILSGSRQFLLVKQLV
jgi:hypothetical protein